MSMKRRGFLQMLGGACTAPLMPSVSIASATKAAYPASARHAAIYHARTRVNFSVFALAQQLGLKLAEAEAVMVEMSDRGILGPLQGTTQSGRWARSHVLQRPFADGATARKLADARRAKARDAQSKTFDEDGSYLHAFLTHLYDLCRAQGRVLHPSCAKLLAQ